MDIGAIDIVSAARYGAPPAGAAGSEQALANAFDGLFMKLLWSGMTASIAGDDASEGALGDWGDALFDQVLTGIADRQGLGFGRLLLEQAGYTAKGDDHA